MDCTNMNDANPKVDIAPHDLFEWIKKNIILQKNNVQQKKIKTTTKEELRKEYENIVKRNSDKRLPTISYFDFLEEKTLETFKDKVSDEELEFQNLTCLVNGFELNNYQKALAKKEYEKLLAFKINVKE